LKGSFKISIESSKIEEITPDSEFETDEEIDNDFLLNWPTISR